MALTITSESYRDELLKANPGRMLVMCYDETLEALDTALVAIEQSDIEARFNAIAVATELLSTLFLCLDMKNGGEIAENLGRIYAFVLKSLPRVNLYNDPVPARQAIELLLPLREAWCELDRQGECGAMGAALDATAIETARSVRAGRGEEAGA